MPYIGPHITVTQNILVVQLNETAKSIDFQFDTGSKELKNGTYYDISGKTNRIKLTLAGDIGYMYLDLEGSQNITFTDQARLIVTGPEPGVDNQITVDNPKGTHPAYFRQVMGDPDPPQATIED